MNKRMIKSKLRCLRRILLLCLCAVLLCSAACAESIVDLGLEGWDSIGYAATLPDGRMIFSGCVGEVGNYMNSKARLLCLNPDGTRSWEYLYPQEGSCSFHGVSILKDGTLAVYFRDDPHQETKEEKVVFFTMDGQPTGKETEFQPGNSTDISIGYLLAASGIMEQYIAFGLTDSDEYCMRLSDWDGNLLFQRDEPSILGLSLIEAEDGLVIIGREPGLLSNAAGKIMKIDFQGNTVWETTVPFLNEANEGVDMRGIKTSDGCYLAVLYERGLNSGSPDSEGSFALVKFSATGRILWMNRESFDNRPEKGFAQVVEYNGKYVVSSDYSALEHPVQYLWFDTDGKELGVTENQVRKEDLPRIGNKKNVNGFPAVMISTEAGLWQEYLYWCDESTHEKELASQGDVLIRIPEL